jgi:hypothetical protein
VQAWAVAAELARKRKLRERAQERRDRAAAAAEPLLPPAERIEVLAEPPLPETDRGLDEVVLRTAQHLAALELEVGRLALRVWRNRGWKQLDYASPEQYAREDGMLWLADDVRLLRLETNLGGARYELVPVPSTALAIELQRWPAADAPR